MIERKFKKPFWFNDEYIGDFNEKIYEAFEGKIEADIEEKKGMIIINPVINEIDWGFAVDLGMTTAYHDRLSVFCLDVLYKFKEDANVSLRYWEETEIIDEVVEETYDDFQDCLKFKKKDLPVLSKKLLDCFNNFVSNKFDNVKLLDVKDYDFKKLVKEYWDH